MPSFKGYSSPWPVSTFVGDEFLLEKNLSVILTETGFTHSEGISNKVWKS